MTRSRSERITPPALEFGVNESLDCTIEDGLGVPDLVVCSVVLHSIIVDHVTADLRPPSLLDFATGGLIEFRLPSFFLKLF